MINTFDGRWSVVIHTQAGGCGPEYRYGVQIINGNITTDAGKSAGVSGRVLPNGAVSVSISAGGANAVGQGRLSPTNGGGTWRGHSSGESCAGVWQARPARIALLRWRLLAFGRAPSLLAEFPGQVVDLENNREPNLKVVNFEQTHPRGCHRFGATPLAEGNRANFQERQAQRIRAICRALFDNGDGCEGPELSRYSTRNGGRVAKARRCSSTPFKTRINANAIATTSRPLGQGAVAKIPQIKNGTIKAPEDDPYATSLHGSSSLLGASCRYLTSISGDRT